MLNFSGQVALCVIVRTVHKVIHEPEYRSEFDEWYRNTYGKEYVPERVYSNEKEVEEVSQRTANWLVYLGDDYIGSYVGTEQEAIEYFDFTDEERERVIVEEDTRYSEYMERGY